MHMQVNKFALLPVGPFAQTGVRDGHGLLSPLW